MTSKKQAPKSAKKSSKKQTVWDRLGVTPQDPGLFYRPRSTGWNRVDVVDVRETTPFTKQLPGGADDIRIQLVLDVMDNGLVVPWEITAVTLREALIRAIVDVPCTVWVRRVGRGKHTRYEVATSEPVDDEEQAAADSKSASPRRDAPAGEVCSRPSCVLDAGHVGDHKTQKQWRAAHGTKATALGA